MEQFKLDVAIEEGDIGTVRMYKSAGYSLYAKQMAMVNGHDDVINYIEKFSKQRNNIGVVPVHYRFDRNSGKWEWDDCIPEHLRKRFLSDVE
jgi:hypothetical protein